MVSLETSPSVRTTYLSLTSLSTPGCPPQSELGEEFRNSEHPKCPSQEFCVCFPPGCGGVGAIRKTFFLRESLAWRGRAQQDLARSARAHACWAGSRRSPGPVRGHFEKDHCLSRSRLNRPRWGTSFTHPIFKLTTEKPRLSWAPLHPAHKNKKSNESLSTRALNLGLPPPHIPKC